MRCRVSQARMSAWPRGKAATASCASRQDWGDGVAPGSGGWSARAGWTGEWVGAATLAAGAAGWPGLATTLCANDNKGARSTNRKACGGREDRQDKDADARMAISIQRTKKALRCCPGHPVGRELRPWQTHFGRWRSGDGWFEAQCGRRTVKPCGSCGQLCTPAAVGAGLGGCGAQHG